ncbi:hypothetical protein AB0T83_01715 [Fluviibacterium sp. DFM31]|uniref:Dihydroorotate dehydrogenase n=1 Tax=Meridianimarinicoccus marinus TaxID=3231483 RepID=A0ABV3L1U0_9RHOB
MTDRQDRFSDVALDDLFASARQDAAAPVPDPFLERCMGDALEVLDDRLAAKLAPPKARWRPFARLVPMLGRIAVPTGLTASALVGVWLGGWAENTGLLTGDAVVSSVMSSDLTYRIPEIVSLWGGY